jgi:hypothetical protein
LLEGFNVLRIGTVQMFCLCDEAEVVVTLKTRLSHDALKRFQVVGVDDQEFVLVELDLHGLAAGNHGYSRAAVIQEQVLIIAKVAHQDGKIDVFTKAILVPGPIRVMTGLEDHVDNGAQRFKEAEEEIEKSLTGHRCGQHRHLQAGLRVPVRFQTESFPGNHLEVQRRANGIGQPEIAVTIHAQMTGQVLYAHVTPCVVGREGAN